MPRVLAGGVEMVWEATEEITILRIDRTHLEEGALWRGILDRVARRDRAHGLMVDCTDLKRWPAHFHRSMTRHLRDRPVHLALVGLPRGRRFVTWLFARVERLDVRVFDTPEAALAWLKARVGTPA